MSDAKSGKYWGLLIYPDTDSGDGSPSITIAAIAGGTEGLCHRQLEEAVARPRALTPNAECSVIGEADIT